MKMLSPRPGAICSLLLLSGTFVCAILAQDPPAEEGVATSEERPASRADVRRALRQQKLQQLAPPQPPQVKRLFTWIEQRGRERVENFNFKRFFPKVGGLSTGSGFAFGTRYWNPRLRGSAWDLQASASASFEGYQLADLQLGHINQPERKLNAFLELRYRDFPQEDFFGVGIDSRESNRSNFRMEDAFAGGNIHFRGERLGVGVRGGYHQINIGPGTDTDFPTTQALFNEGNTPGLSRQPNFLEIGGHFQLDFRDQPGNAHSGGLIRVEVRRFQDLQLGEFDFTRVAMDGASFIPLGSSGRTLALRLQASFDVEDRGERVPFYLQRTLGGSEDLRGYREFRFRDQNLLAASAEYRWEAMPALEFALFSDAGKVFQRRSDFSLSDLRGSFGVGLRVKTRSSVVFRIDLARSSEGTRIYLKFRPVF